MNPLQDYLDPNNPKYDPCLPTEVNLPHQQYDPCGIYSIAAITHREDGVIRHLDSFIAYQKYDIVPITVDFRILVERYSHNDRSNTGLTVGGF